MGKIIRDIRLDVNALALESVFVTRDECAALIRVLARRTASAIWHSARIRTHLKLRSLDKRPFALSGRTHFNGI
jgi:hypothetical protein